MTGLAHAHATPDRELMMTRLGINPGAEGSLSLEYANTMRRRCEACRCKVTCRAWLDCAPAGINFAPFFCPNAETLFELQRTQSGPRWVGYSR